METPDGKTKRGYAGLGWLRAVLQHEKQPREISPLGERVADLLGDLFYGIYHINKEVLKVDWADKHHIVVTLHDSMGGGWATFDYSNLTRFVLLCHEYGLRGSIEAAAYRYIRLVFHDPVHSSGGAHPTIAEALERFNGVASE